MKVEVVEVTATISSTLMFLQILKRLRWEDRDTHLPQRMNASRLSLPSPFDLGDTAASERASSGSCHTITIALC